MNGVSSIPQNDKGRRVLLQDLVIESIKYSMSKTAFGGASAAEGSVARFREFRILRFGAL